MKRPTSILLIAFLGGVLGLDCAGIRIARPFRPGPDDWTTFGGASSRTNQTRVVIQPPLKEVWRYNALGGISCTPLVRDSIVVIGTLHGELQAVNMQNGKRIGYVVLESAIVGTPALDGTNIIIPVSSNNESLVSMSLRSPERQWGVQLGPIESSPLVLGDNVYVTTLDGVALCVMKNDGGEVWKFKTQNKEDRKPIRSSPCTDGENVYFGGDDGFVYAVTSDKGELRWKFKSGNSVFASPIAVSRSVIVGSLDGYLYCLDASSGTVRWKYDTKSKIYGAAATNGETVFVGSADGICHALETRHGTLKWKFSVQSVIDCAPLVSGEILYLGALDRTLYAVRIEDGKEVWKYSAEGRIRVSPVAWGGMLFVTSEDKYITALKPAEPL